MLERFGSLGGIAGAAPGELVHTSSAGPALRAELTLVREFAVRLARAEACRRPVITSWTALVAYVRAALAHEPREQFRTRFLDRRNILLQDEITGDRTVDHAPVYQRKVIRRALELSASALILVHNHPSGDPTPSQADIQIKSQGSAQRFLSSHGPIYNAFNLQPHLISRAGLRTLRGLADDAWTAARRAA